MQNAVPRTVVIFGAGASRSAGGPLMNDFLDKMEEVHVRGWSQPYQEDFERVLKAHYELQRVFAKSTLDLDNIEVLYSAFEMAALLKTSFRGLDLSIGTELTASIRRAIVRTLECSMPLQMKDRAVVAPPHYSILADAIAQSQRPPLSTRRKITLATFNYDTSLDLALSEAHLEIDYVIGTATPTHAQGHVEVLKLHGSLNWGSEGDDHIDVVQPRDFLRRREMIGPDLYRTDFLGSGGHGDPLIVPPSWSKSAHYNPIRGVWSRAAQRLSEADTIIVVGYSLPRTDEFFRYLYALGTLSQTRIKHIEFVSLDEEAYTRFKGMLGGVAAVRLKPFKSTTFEEYVPKLAARIKTVD